MLNSLGLLSFKGVGNELAAKTWVVFGLGIFAFFATIAAIICGGEFIIIKRKNRVALAFRQRACHLLGEKGNIHFFVNP